MGFKNVLIPIDDKIIERKKKTGKTHFELYMLGLNVLEFAKLEKKANEKLRKKQLKEGVK